MADAGALFLQGYNIGAAVKDRKRRRALEERQQQESELNSAVQRRRMEAVAQSIEMEVQEKKADAARFVEAEAALGKFGTAVQSIDWSSPNARREYEQAVRLHLPSIQKHESSLKKWESFHSVTRQSQAFTDAKLAEMQMDDLRRAALDAGVGVEGVAVSEEVKAGRMSAAEGVERLRQLVVEKEKQVFERNMELRKASNPGKAPGLMPGEKAELDAVAAELTAVNKELANPKLSVDDKSILVGRKASLQRRLRSFDKASARGGQTDGAQGGAGEPGPSAPAPGRKYQVEVLE